MDINHTGIFCITTAIIDADYTAVAKCLSIMEFVPIRVETLYCGKVIMSEISRKFREVPKGQHTPYYKISAITDATGIIDVDLEETDSIGCEFSL